MCITAGTRVWRATHFEPRPSFYCFTCKHTYRFSIYAMAESDILSLKNVATALFPLTIEQTKELIIYFGIELKVITDIEATNKGSSCIKHHSIQAWLDRDTEASWEKIVYGLEQIGMKVIARKVAKLHCPHLVAATTPTIDSHQPATVHPPQPINTLAPLTPAMPSHISTIPVIDSVQSHNLPPNTTTPVITSADQSYSPASDHSQPVALPPSHSTSPAHNTTSSHRTPSTQNQPTFWSLENFKTALFNFSSLWHSPQENTTRGSHTNEGGRRSTSQVVPAVRSEQPPRVCQPSPCTFWSLEKVKATILQLEEMFAKLQAKAQVQIAKLESDDQTFFPEFRSQLLLLPVAKRAPHIKFFRENEDDIISSKNTLKIMAILCRYIDYRNYEILFHLITRFCGVPLQENKKKYRLSLETFEMHTTVDIYISAVPDEISEEIENGFSQMVVKINKPSSECTLHEVRKLNEAMTTKSGLESHSVYISGVAKNCVVVAMRFPSSAVGWVLAAMTPDFIHTQHLTPEITMDGKQLTIIQAERQELVCTYTCLSVWGCVANRYRECSK